MGLAGPRNRTKISHDPRNTAWSNSTSRFGHRILTDLGWAPGSTLGDTTSLYHQSGHITAASQAGVKIVLKDDNLGIGCNKRAREDECVGLDGLQDLLGRLNGKDEATIGKEKESREKVRRTMIVGERYGMRFVKGETYVSSDIDTLLKRIEGEKKIKEEETEQDENIAVPLDELPLAKIKKEKKEKRSKREKSSSKSSSATPISSEEIDSKSSPKKRKRPSEDETEKKATRDSGGDKKAPKMSKKSKNGETRDERKVRREREKREREVRKAEKKKNQKASDSNSSDSSDGEESTAPSGTATPSIPPALVGRQAVRHRYIAAKRSAVMDAKALNEIFMIKA